MDAITVCFPLTIEAEGFSAIIYQDNGHDAIGYGDDLLDATSDELKEFHEHGISIANAQKRCYGKLTKVQDMLASTEVYAAQW